MSDDWREMATESSGDERPGFGVGQLGDGDKLVVTFESDGEVFENKFGGESVRFDVVMNRASIPVVEDTEDNPVGEDTRATLLVSSKRCMSALAELDDSLVGRKVRISKEGTDMDVQYEAELIDLEGT